MYVEESEDDIAPGMERCSPPANDGNGGEVQNGGLSRLAFSLTVEKARLTVLTEVNEAPVSSLCVYVNYSVAVYLSSACTCTMLTPYPG